MQGEDEIRFNNGTLLIRDKMDDVEGEEGCWCDACTTSFNLAGFITEVEAYCK